MTHPASCRAIAADVAESTFVNAIRRTEADLFDGLVDDQTFGVVVDDA